MEQVNGGELYEQIHNGSMTQRLLASLIYQLLEAIDYMHSSGIAHRDLKPENILVKFNENNYLFNSVKVADFGLSKINTPNQLMFDGCGTPSYVAPEILNHKGYGK